MEFMAQSSSKFFAERLRVFKVQMMGVVEVKVEKERVCVNVRDVELDSQFSANGLEFWK